MKRLHAFIFLLSIIVFSLTSCEKNATDDATDNFVGLSLTEDGSVNSIVNGNLSEAVDLDLLSEANENELDLRANGVSTVVSKGSISNSETLRRFKWDITHEFETAAVSGPSARLTFESDDLSFDVDMRNVCTEIANFNETKAINIFQITNVRSISGSRANKRAIRDNPYVFIWTKDEAQDKHSDINVLSRDVMFELLDIIGGGTEADFVDMCFYIEAGVFPKNILFGSSHRTVINVPADDWLQVRLR